MRRHSPRLLWLLIPIFTLSSAVPTQQPQVPIELRENDPLSYAVFHARRTNNQFALSDIAVHYAELGNFEQALRVNESATAEDWRTGAFGKIALEYWKQGQPDKARELFLRVAKLPLPKDYIYIWGDIIVEMAQARMFELALDTDKAMADAGGSTAGDRLAMVVEEFIKAKADDPTLPDILPRVIAISKSLPESNNKTVAVKRVAWAYVAQGQYDRATKLVQAFEDDFDRDDGAQELAIEFARRGLYDRALPLAHRAGDYFGPMALVGIASEALKRGDKTTALDVIAQTLSLIAKYRETDEYEPNGTEATRLSEMAVLYLQLERKSRAVELADLSFDIARKVGKPGERYSALRSVVEGYCALGLYDKATEAAKALAEHELLHFNALAEIGEHALRSGHFTVAAAANFVTKTPTAKTAANELLRLKALVRIARAGAEQGRIAEARQLLSSLAPIAAKLEPTENTPEILKDFAVAFAETGDIRTALQHIPQIHEPYFITRALIDIGVLCAKKKLPLDAGDIALLNEIVIPPEIHPPVN